jgi:hypothetical protein
MRKIKPTQDQLQARVAELEKALRERKYQEARALAYLNHWGFYSLEDQLRKMFL